ncbi:Formate--tetrahydrofolate ligase [Frankliniella fusca]|uniref:Formate--tetrahydrofolate ligase n=1 Tax=Frankliniella fusca TaxID=407009 RepID=A0AAE1GZV5_9NEOP|nr:Formate--tetrahydrofolate ligase [Frankliniella fusca]
MRTVAALVVYWACLTACLAWTLPVDLPAGNPEENEVLPAGGGGGDPAPVAGGVRARTRTRLPPTTGSWDWARWPLAFTTTEYSAAVRPLARRRGCLSLREWRSGSGSAGARAAATGHGDDSPELPEQDVAEDGGGGEDGDVVGPGPAWSAYWTPQEAAAASRRLPVHRGSSVGRKVLYKGAASVPPGPGSAADGAPMSLALPLPAESIAAADKTTEDADVAANLLE